MNNRVDDLYVIGGKYKRNAWAQEEYHAAASGLVLHVDVEARSVTPGLEYVSPQEAVPDREPSILFKSSELVGDKLYACTQTEVLIYRMPEFQLENYVSLPCFNDVHHVRPTKRGTLLVVSTGLDMVVEISVDGQIVREWSVVGGDTWQKFDRHVDYRKVATTKPHEAHPNYVFEYDDHIWVTRLIMRDAICLTDPERRIDVAVERPHDGVVFGDRIYFTTVDGHVVVVNGNDGSTEFVCDLNQIRPSDISLGWCRGLFVVDDERVIVGFSRLRPTKLLENVRWLRTKFTGKEFAHHMPARIAQYNLKQRTLDWEINLEDHGMGIVFSVHPKTATLASAAAA